MGRKRPRRDDAPPTSSGGGSGGGGLGRIDEDLDFVAAPARGSHFGGGGGGGGDGDVDSDASLLDEEKPKDAKRAALSSSSAGGAPAAKAKGGASSAKAGGGDGEAGYDGGDGAVGLRARILDLLGRRTEGLPSRSLTKRAGASIEDVTSVLGGLIAEARVEVMRIRGRGDGGGGSSTVGDTQLFRLVSVERAEKVRGLSDEDLAVLQLVERTAASGVWVRQLKLTSKLQPAALSKILKRLEGRKLIKAVTSVAKNKLKMYMGFDIGELLHIVYTYIYVLYLCTCACFTCTHVWI
jgi:hypothetical protein